MTKERPYAEGAKKMEEYALRRINEMRERVEEYLRPRRFFFRTSKRKRSEERVAKKWAEVESLLEGSWPACAQVQKALSEVFRYGYFAESIEGTRCSCWRKTLTPEEFRVETRKVLDDMLANPDRMEELDNAIDRVSKNLDENRDE